MSPELVTGQAGVLPGAAKLMVRLHYVLFRRTLGHTLQILRVPINFFLAA